MKKFYNLFSIFSCFLILIMVNTIIYDFFYLTKNYNIIEYKVYAYDNLNLPKIKCENYFIYDKTDIDSNKIFTNKLGEEIVIYADKGLLEKIINELNLEFVFSDENFEYNSFFYSSKINNFYYINNQKINVQIYYKNNKIILGTPLIFGFM